MAMTYQNFASLGVNLNRQKNGPLDISNVFTSEADLKYYLTEGAFTTGVSKYWYESADKKVVPYPYEGQVLATAINGEVKVYVLRLDAQGKFEAKAIEPEVDGNTIKLTNGKLELVGLPTDTQGKTYVPSYINGVLTWAEPDTSTAEGQAQEIEGLKTRTKALEDTVNGTEGLVAKVAALESVDNATQAELDAYKEVVTAAIAAGVKEAKDYADANDANTVYDDTALAARVKALEDEERYDETPLANRVGALETAVGSEASGLVKGLADEIKRAQDAEKALDDAIKAIDFVDEAELESAVNAGVSTAKAYTDEQIGNIEDVIAGLNHFTTKIVTSVEDVKDVGVLYLIKDTSVAGVDKYNEYLFIDGEAVLIGDTTTDLSDYYTKSELNAEFEAVEGALADEVEAREALAEEVAALKEIDNATQAELDEYKEQVTNEITDAVDRAIEAAAEDAAAKSAVVLASAQQYTEAGFEYAVSTAAEDAAAKAAVVLASAAEYTDTKMEEAVETAVAQAASAEEAKGYAVATVVTAALATKVESATIAHATEQVAEGATVNGTQLNIVIDAYTKGETDQHIESAVAASASTLNSALQEYKTTNDARVATIEATIVEHGTAIVAAQAQADKGVNDAAAVASALATANIAIADNTREIGVAKGSIETVNSTLSNKITALENADTTIKSDITALQGIVSGENGHASRLVALESRASTLEGKDTELAGLIQANTDKFAGYYTKSEVDAAVQGAIDAIPDVDFTPYATTEYVNTELGKKANAADVYTKTEADAEFMTESEVDARINALIAASDPEGDGNVITNIQNLVEYVENNAGEISALITATGANTAKLDGIDGTVKGAIDAAIAAIVMPKASNEITIAADGTLGLGNVSTDKLVMGNDTLIIDGGSAAN